MRTERFAERKSEQTDKKNYVGHAIQMVSAAVSRTIFFISLRPNYNTVSDFWDFVLLLLLASQYKTKILRLSSFEKFYQIQFLH